ncbi:MAG TPA: hypothetical protein VFO76_10730 [Candidatus Kapabacteria bacterium]|nr:hypothetical protein [Candidatus Kapabacteria bacterium]
MPPLIQNTTTTVLPKKPRSRWRKILYILLGLILAVGLGVGVVVIFYPDVVLDYAIEPKLKQLVADRLGGKYSLTMDSIFFSHGKDSLIIIGGHITENANDTDIAMRMPLDRLTTDTIVVAGLDYWRLVLQKGLFAANVTIRSPKIYLRTGTMPKFEKQFFPDFMPVVSSREVKLENAQLFFSDKANELRMGRGLNVSRAEVILKDFYLDEPTFRNPNSTFFCKSATFHASDISHLDSLDATDLNIASVDGDLIDSSMKVTSIEFIAPIEEVRHLGVSEVSIKGLDWSAALSGKGLHIQSVAVSTPHIDLQPVADIRSTSATVQRIKAADLIPLPSLVPNVAIGSLEVSGAEISTKLPQQTEPTIIKPLNATLTELLMDKTTPFSNVSTFFSKRAQFSVDKPTDIKTTYGTLTIENIAGTEQSIRTKDITFHPNHTSLHDVRLITLESAQIFGLDFWRLFRREGFISKSMVVSRPSVYLTETSTAPVADMRRLLAKDPLEPIRNFSEYPLPDIIPIMSIGSVSVNNAQLHGIHFLDEHLNKPGRGDSICGIMLSLKTVKLDPMTWTTKRGTLFSDAGTFSIGTITHSQQGLAMGYKVEGVSGDLGNGTLTMNTLTIRPKMNKVEYCNSFVCRTEYLGLVAPSVTVSGVSYDKLFSGKGFFADNVSCSNWDLTIYSDKRKPEAEQKTDEVYPHEMFQYVKMPFAINRVTLRNGGILYGEHWPEVDESGQISIDTINAVIGPLSNQIPIDSPTTINGSMKIMSQAPVEYKISYELNNPRFNLEMMGKAGAADASLFNNFLGKIEPFTLRGNVQSAEFGISIKDSQMTGRVVPIYDSLTVDFFRWDKFPPGVFSWLANSIFMRSHNTTNGTEPPAIGEINTMLDRKTNIYWSLWHPIRSAIGDVVRIPEWVW